MPNADEFSGGDKPRPYPFGETLFVVAGFIPACKGAEHRNNRSDWIVIFFTITFPEEIHL
jgi:hypothetical protein